MNEQEILNSPIKKIHRPVSAPLSSETNTQYTNLKKKKKKKNTQKGSKARKPLKHNKNLGEVDHQYSINSNHAAHSFRIVIGWK
jgi:hypothetical protein